MSMAESVIMAAKLTNNELWGGILFSMILCTILYLISKTGDK